MCYFRIRSTFATGLISHLAQGLSVTFILQSARFWSLTEFVPKSLQGSRAWQPLDYLGSSQCLRLYPSFERLQQLEYRNGVGVSLLLELCSAQRYPSESLITMPLERSVELFSWDSSLLHVACIFLMLLSRSNGQLLVPLILTLGSRGKIFNYQQSGNMRHQSKNSHQRVLFAHQIRMQ